MTELVGSALAMVEAAFVRHNIQVERDFEEVPTVPVDRTKVMQILVNLLTNAKEAVKACDENDKRLSLRVGLGDGDRVIVEISDSGKGIATEDLTRIFAEGFSTKTGGRGFGLHYSALAASEMGGKLTADSDGPGAGATFVLELPCKAKVKSSLA